MARKLPAGALRSFPVRIDTRPIRSTDAYHNHAFRASVALKDLPESHGLGTWFKQTSTTDANWFVTMPIDKTKYQRKPKGVHEVTQDGSRARFLISPGIFEPYRHNNAASYSTTAYEWEDGSIHFPAPTRRRESRNPARTVADIVGASNKPKGKTRVKAAALSVVVGGSREQPDISDVLAQNAPTLLSEDPVPNFRFDRLAHDDCYLVERITSPNGSVCELYSDGTKVERFPPLTK